MVVGLRVRADHATAQGQGVKSDALTGLARRGRRVASRSRWPAIARLLAARRRGRRSDAGLPHGRDRPLRHLLLRAARRRRAPARRGRRARAPHAVAGARSPARREDDHRPRRRHRQRERLRRRAAAQRDPAVRDRADRVQRARRSRRLAVRPGRPRVHAHPPPRHDGGPAEHLQPDLRQDLGAEPDHAALDHRGHRGLRGVQAQRRRPQPRHPVRSVHPDRAHDDHKDLRLDEVSGAPRRFPRGNAVYVYGSHFLRYVFDRFGDDTLRKMAHVVGQLRAAVRGQPPDREGRRQAVHRAVRRLEGLPARSLRHAGGWPPSAAGSSRGRRADPHRREQPVAALQRRRQGAVVAAVRRLLAADGARDAGRRRSGRARATSCRSTRWGRSTCSPTARWSTSRAGRTAATTRIEDLFRWDARDPARPCGCRSAGARAIRRCRPTAAASRSR